MSPSASVLRKAVMTLATSPVPNYPAFSRSEVRALASYRCQFPAGDADAVWNAIVNAAPEAWMFAVHEAAEMEAFAAANIDFTDPQLWYQNLPQAHIHACIKENSFLKVWADHLGYNTTEMALEINNPFRRPHPSHRNNIAVVQQQAGWDWPNADEENEAVTFFRRILS